MFRICSYNLHGYNSTKTNYIKLLLNRSEILMIQEHWMNNMQLERFSNLFSCSSIHGISSIDTSKLLVARPHGGCCFVYKNHLSSSIKNNPYIF